MGGELEGTVERALPGRPAWVCPYLLAADGAWRAVVPAGEHRCTAVAPPTPVAPAKQRRLCLDERHRTCATFLAARGDLGGSPAPDRPNGEAAAVGRVRPGRWRFAATTPIVLDRAPGLGPISARTRLGQAALVGLVILAFGVLAVARSTIDSPETAGASRAPASPPPTASLAPSAPLPSRSPSPSSSATAEATPSPSPVATPGPSVAPSPSQAYRTTYRVRSGDTLSAIAARFGTTVKAIVELNDIADPSLIHAGQLLKIP